MRKCSRCGFKKCWSGDDINCPFQEADVFGENWNCGLIGRIRDVCDSDDPRVHKAYCEDQYYACIKIDELENAQGEYIGLCLWVTWYKNRGATDDMWILSSGDAPRHPTFGELTLIADHFKATCS